MPSIKGVPIVLGGEKRILRFTTRSLVRLEMETGKTVHENAIHAQQGKMACVVALVWAGCLHMEPKLKMDEVVDWFEPTDLSDVADAIGKAVEQAFGVDLKEEAGKEDGAESGKPSAAA